MDHADIRRKLPAYLDNDVSAEEKLEIKKHLGVCGICRGALADLELTMWHLKHLPEVEPPPWLSDKILAEVLAPSKPKPRIMGRFSSLFLRRPLLVVLVVVLLCGIGYFVFRMLRPEAMISSPSPASRKAPPSPEQTPAAQEKLPGTPPPPRALPPTSTPASPSTSPAMAPSGGEVPPSGPVPSLAPAPSPTPNPPEEPEQEKALPGREPLQPFGREE